MAETTLKRPREETQVEEAEEEMKRHRSYNHILSLLEADEEEPNQDLSSLITTLQQELSSEPNSNPLSEPASEADTNTTTSSSPSIFKEDEEDKERFIRHLLEASDDELGIPHGDIRVVEEAEEEINGGEGCGFSLFDGLWEFEDDNYYTL